MPGYLASVQCQESNEPICTLEAGVHSAEHNHVYICTSLHAMHIPTVNSGIGILEQSMWAIGIKYTVKKGLPFPVPSRDITSQILPGRE
jgi:hypothetical protein